ncbi:MAG: hypothetical protein LBM69_03355 [Lachnospiraceae bacterium]|nr:hypothetical protein [Lachnospiraceae bacterium]
MKWRIEEREAFEVFGIERVYHNDEQIYVRRSGRNVIKMESMKGYSMPQMENATRMGMVSHEKTGLV